MKTCRLRGILGLRCWAVPVMADLLGADPPGRLWVWPAHPRVGKQTKAQGSLGAHRYLGTGEPSFLSLLSSYSPTPSFRNRDLIEGILSGRMDPYGSAGQQRDSGNVSGKWEAGSSMVAVLKRKRSKVPTGGSLCFHSHIWWLAAGMAIAGCLPVHTTSNWILRHGFDMTKDGAGLGCASSLRDSPSPL